MTHSDHYRREHRDFYRTKVGQTSKLTKLRIRYFELKIRVNDMCDRIVDSFHDTLFRKTQTRQVNQRKPTSKQTYAMRPQRSKIRTAATVKKRNILNRHCCTDWETTERGNRVKVPARSKSTERFNHYRRTRHMDVRSSSKERGRGRRKQRSSLTRRQSSSYKSDQLKLSLERRPNRHTGTGDDITSSKNRKVKSANSLTSGDSRVSSDFCNTKVIKLFVHLSD